MPGYLNKYANLNNDSETNVGTKVVQVLNTSLASISGESAAQAEDEKFDSHMATLAGEQPEAPRQRRPFREVFAERAKRRNEARHRINAMVESLIKVRVLNKPKGSTPLGQFAWKEKLNHFSTTNPKIADVLDILLHDWEQKGRPGPFLRWVEANSGKYLQDRIPRDLITKFREGVTYLGEMARQSYRLTAAGGKLHQNGKPFETREIRTIWGKGFAIFVMSPSGWFYAGEQETGEMHHSSFLAGNPVGAAGEMVVHAGVLQLINAKSGHYRPGPETLVNAIKTLETMGIPSASYKVRVYEMDQQKKPIRNQDPNCVDPFTKEKVPVGHSPPFYLSAAWYVQSWRKFSVWGYDELAQVLEAHVK